MRRPGCYSSPGWRAAQLKRRDPSLVLRTHEAIWPTSTDIVLDNATNRPVLITARLLDVDPSLRERSGYLPRGMLLRAVSVKGKAALAADARAMLDSGRCGGCQVGAFDVGASPLESSRVVD